MEFLFYVLKNEPYTFDLTLLGYGADEAVPVHDIWANGFNLFRTTGTLTTTVPSHGVRLFRLGSKAETTKVEAIHNAECIMHNSSAGAVYDLSGRMVNGSRFKVQGSPLPNSGGAGGEARVYIVNGKKTLVH